LRIVAIVEICIGLIFIPLNLSLKLGIRARNGATELGRSLICLTKRNSTSKTCKSYFVDKYSKPSRTQDIIIQVSFYVFGLLTILFGVYYIENAKWLLSPYLVLLMYLWLMVLIAFSFKASRPVE
jgi:hypothetical protein